MDKELFRKQVVDARNAASRRFGRPAATVPPAWTWFIAGIAGFLCCVLIFLYSVDFARKETVRGQLRHKSAEARVYPSDAGILSHVYVSDGQMVEAGDPLVEVRRDRILSNGARLESEAEESIVRQIEALEALKSTAGDAAETALQRVEQSLARDSEGLIRARERRAQLVSREMVAARRLERTEGFLVEGLVTESDVVASRDAVEAIRTAIFSTDDEIAQLVSEIDAAPLERQRIRTDKANELASVDERIAELQARLTQNDFDTGYRIVSAINGRVTALQARPGESVGAARFLMAIVPTDSTLVAELFLPSSAIAFVEPGQEVRLLYDAFPYQKFGTASGRVYLVASTAVLGNDLGLPVGDEPVYRVEVELAEQAMNAFGKQVALQSGMELSADIVLEDRRLVEWVLAPVRGAS